MAQANLTYFDGRGLAERVRVALAAAGITYTETYLQKEGDLEEVDGKCLFGAVPLLEIDGLQLVQSWAIVRYLAQKNGLTPPTPAMQARAEMCFEQVHIYSL
jgi:glutathione S-transferase